MTEHEIDLNGLTRNQRDLHDLLLQTELSGVAADAYKLSHAGTGQSGYSVGHSQVDLSKKTTYADLIGKLVDKIEGISDADKITIKNNLKEKGISPTIEANIEKINTKLQTPEGHAVVDEIHKHNLRDVDGKVQAVINAATVEAKAFLDTPLGRALVADNINQYGPPNRMTSFMAGKEVRFAGQNHALRGPLDIGTYVDYVGGYFFSQLEPADMQR